MPLHLGAIADDFTGASDLANMLVQNGMRTILMLGVPDRAVDGEEADAIVIALKSRTVDVDVAVSDSLAALNWLRSAGAEQFFFKYCSTFDSTPRGNIGPVADALTDAVGSPIAIVCPAYPETGRTVYRGHLFVGDQLLSDSPMKDHPLTPMTDSSLVRLMAEQSAKQVGLVAKPVVSQGVDALAAELNRLAGAGFGYAVVDAINAEDLRTIGAAAADHQIITGGSGVAIGLPENFRRAGKLGAPAGPRIPEVGPGAIVVAGSCSAATREQIAHASRLWPSLKLDFDGLGSVPTLVDETVRWVDGQPKEAPVIVYSSADPDNVADLQATYGVHEAGALIEKALADVTVTLVERGMRRIVVAGGETSGAVVQALGVTGLRIGPEIDPGVPWTETLEAPYLALALKSGNFGGRDFFEKAIGMLP